MRVTGLDTLLHQTSDDAMTRVCSAPWTTSFIAWNGDVHPCCFYITKSFGNVFKQPFREIWNGREYVELRRKLIEGKEEFCNRCLSGAPLLE